MRAMTGGAAPHGAWVPVPEAARLMGVHRRVLLRWISRGEVAARRTPSRCPRGFRYEVLVLEGVVHRSPRASGKPRWRYGPGSGPVTDKTFKRFCEVLDSMGAQP